MVLKILLLLLYQKASSLALKIIGKCLEIIVNSDQQDALHKWSATEGSGREERETTEVLPSLLVARQKGRRAREAQPSITQAAGPESDQPVSKTVKCNRKPTFGKASTQ